jgi:anti-anti-sigma factor
VKCYEVTKCSPQDRQTCYVWNTFSQTPQDMENLKCWILKGAYQDGNKEQLTKCQKCKYFLMINEQTGVASTFDSDLAIVSLEGVINNERSKAIEKVWESLKANNRTRVLLRLKDVSNIYSAGLGTLIKVHKECSAAGGILVVEGARGYVQSLLSGTKLDRILNIAADDAAARKILDEFKQKLERAAAVQSAPKPAEPPKPPKERVPCYVYWKDHNPRNATKCDECSKKIHPTDQPCWIVEGMIEGVSFQYVNEECEDCKYFHEFGGQMVGK